MICAPRNGGLWSVLLAHHRTVVQPLGTTFRPHETFRKFTTTYLTMCNAAGVPELVQSTGQFLAEIAQWCKDNDWPPLNALVVNAGTGLPGDAYTEAAGCSDWLSEIAACLTWHQYPTAMP